MNGFGNALSFKNINEDDIEFCQEEVRKIGISIQRDINDSADMNFEIDEEYLINTFGKTYSKNPSEFQFLRGEISLIKELVAHVKRIVDDGGTNTGLHRFKYKEKRIRNKRKHQQKHIDAQQELNIDHAANTAKNATVNTHNLDELKVNLVDRIKMCLNNHQAGVDIDLTSTVHVEIKDQMIFGEICCVICKDNKPKRVYYDEAHNRWVVTNYQKHLRKSHHLLDSKQRQSDDETTSSSKKKNVAKKKSSQQIANPKEKTPFNGQNGLLTKRIKVEDNENWFYSQLATQINEMVQAVLEHGDDEETMEFELNDNLINVLSVAKILGDGNCLFAAIAHQLWKYPINSKQHNDAVNRLRAEVKDYILSNFESFEFTLKDRVYESKKSSEITDMKAECESYVRNVLSQNGKYGGFETIKAISEMYKVNILTLLEGSTYSFHNKENIHENTIVVAWRFGVENGQTTRNHYDSVYDMNAQNILAISETVVKSLQTN